PRTTINGTAIISYKNCTVEINNITYDDSEVNILEEVKISLPNPSLILGKNDTGKLNLRHLELQNRNNTQEIFEVKETTTNHLISLYTWLGIASVFLITICLLKRRTIIFTPGEPQQHIVPTVPSFWPSLYSRGGGVTTTASSPTSASPPPNKPPRASHMGH
ncbi:hypothetical protein KR018_001410, partial [Drosophila ironensis]